MSLKIILFLKLFFPYLQGTMRVLVESFPELGFALNLNFYDDRVTELT